jgi:hypothetical protein
VWVYMGCICDLAVDGGLCRIHTKSLAAQLDSVCSDINKNDICSIGELVLFSIYRYQLKSYLTLSISIICFAFDILLIY